MKLLAIILICFASRLFAQSVPIELLSPTDGEIAASTDVTFSWVKDTNAIYYKFILARDSAFTVQHGFYSETENTSIDVHLTDNALPLYWRVTGLGKSGWVGRSETRRIITRPLPPAAPEIIFPLENFENVPIDTFLLWDADKAEFSHVQIAKVTLPGVLVLDTVVAGTSLRLDLLPGISYYIWVQGETKGGPGPKSRVKFTTAGVSAPPGKIQLVFPADSSEVEFGPAALNFQWNMAHPVTMYEVIVCMDPQFKNLIFNDSTALLEKYFYPHNNGLYWWRVRARNAKGWGPWSDEWTFYAHYANIGVDGPKNDPVFVITPNPASSTLTVSTKLDEAAPTHFRIVDMKGNEIIEIPDQPMVQGLNMRSIDVSALPIGTYIMQTAAGKTLRSTTFQIVR